MGKSNETIIQVENLSKVFKLPHEKLSTVKQHFLNIFNPKGYEKFKALDNVSFEVKKGEFFGIIGANGSGKSTLLKILAEIYQPTSGKITINGSLSPFIELGVGFNPELTARDNIFLNAAILGLTRKQTESKFDEIIDFAELREFLDQKLKNFSSGMQVRLAFSIAIQAQADILLVDEVLAVGDASFQQKSFDVFRKLKQENKTIIFVSHDLNSIEDFCDRVLYLSRGSVVDLGETKEVVRKYQGKTLAERSDNLKEVVINKVNRWGSGKVLFNSLEIQNIDGKKVKLLKYGKDYLFTLNYKIKTLVKILNIGIGVYSLKDEYCFGVNTKMDNFKVTANGRITLQVKSLPLNKGEYYCNVVIFGEKETQPYDWVGKVGKFVVDTDSLQRGTTILNHIWKEADKF